MNALADIIAVTSLDDLAREATLARTCGHPLAADVLDALVEMRTPETPDLDCARALRRACVSGEEYQRLAEQLDRLRESYRMACRMLRDAGAERDRARELAARLEAKAAMQPTPAPAGFVSQGDFDALWDKLLELRESTVGVGAR